MIAALALLAVFAVQDTTDGLSPRVRDMIGAFQPPATGEVSVGTRFSARQVYVGEQVELVTAAWFPRDLRERLRRIPTLRAPAYSGFWNAPGSEGPTLVQTRRVNGRLYDLFFSHQTLFPLGAGTIEAPSAVLTYAVPSSVSFFAPEDRKSLASRPVSIRVLPIPAQLVADLGNGPTAHAMRVAWRLPNTKVEASTPVTVELVISGEGNVTLWPEPAVNWPSGGRVYTEPTREDVRRPNGTVAGEKRFRFTIVPDSAGVMTLPAVAYPYFDPERVSVEVARAGALPIVIEPARRSSSAPTIPLVTGTWIPVSTRIVERGWPLLVLLGLMPISVMLWRRHKARPIPAPVRPVDAAEQLRRLLGRGVLPEPAEMEMVLRRRGVPREDARQVGRWFAARTRHRWSLGVSEPAVDPIVERVIQQLRGPLVLLCAVGLTLLPLGKIIGQAAEGGTRYRAGDAVGAERLFSQVVDSLPDAPGAWLNLGAARHLGGDNIGAVAAWLHGLRLAPRNRALRDAIGTVPSIPAPVLLRGPSVPLSRDELILLALALWLVAAGTHRRYRRMAIGALSIGAVAGVIAVARTRSAHERSGLVRAASEYRVSPTTGAPVLGTAPAWAIATVERRYGDWYLVLLDDGARGWLAVDRLAPLTRLD